MAGPPIPLSSGRILILAAGFALWVALLEIIHIQLVRLEVALVLVSRDFLWMTPLADLSLFLLLGCILLAVGQVWPRVFDRPVVTGTFGGFATLAMGLALESIHPLAVLLLGIGVGSQVSRWTRGPVRHPRILPISLGVCLFLVGGLAVRGEIKDREAHRYRLTQLGEQTAGAPNLVLLILDTVRGGSLGFLEDLRPQSTQEPVQTPTLEELASRSVLFSKAIAPSPWTLPSHGSMFTGRWANRLSGSDRLGAEADLGLDPQMPTIAQLLSGEGYRTAGFAGNLIWAFAETGLGLGFHTYEDYEASIAQIFLSCSIGRRLASADWLWDLIGYHEVLNRKDAGTVTDQFLDWQQGHQDRPFFAFLNFFDAHEPHFPPDSIKRSMPIGTRWDDFSHSAGLLVGAWAERNQKWGMAPAERDAHAAGYHAAILRMDSEVERLVNELDRRGVLENTVFIITSDHGEQLGEHGLFGHDNSLYLPSLHVPLMIFDARGGPTPKTVRSVVSLRDVAATILDFAGIDAKSVGVQGSSLARYWVGSGEEEGNPREVPSEVAFSVLYGELGNMPWYPAERGPAMYSLVDSAYHYILNGDSVEELFDLRSDPSELSNLAFSPSHQGILNGFRETILEMAPEIWGGRR